MIESQHNIGITVGLETSVIHPRRQRTEADQDEKRGQGTRLVDGQHLLVTR